MGDDSDNASGSEDRSSISALSNASPWNIIQRAKIFALFKELLIFLLKPWIYISNSQWKENYKNSQARRSNLQRVYPLEFALENNMQDQKKKKTTVKGSLQSEYLVLRGFWI